jgi:Zn-dependent oligopeptidase
MIRPHQCIGYDAGFYCYLWSEVFAYEICSKFEQSPGGWLDSDMGQRLRLAILEPCASQTAMGMMTTFLGREPTTDAFCAEHGLDCLRR